MNDIRIDDDSRKQSAKKIKKIAEQMGKGRSFGQFLFDWIVKSLLLTCILAINFTLFANAGSYSIFNPFSGMAMEAAMIYIGITALSLIVVLLSMIFLPLDNLLLSAAFGMLAVVLINQFALFDKNSLLLMWFGELFSDDVNVILYKYAPFFIGGVVFLISYIILKIFSRALLLYFTLAVAALLGWIISQAYFNTYKPIFYNIKEKVTTESDNIGSNLVFLSFSDLTSVNNLYNFYRHNIKNAKAGKAWQTALGFYGSNNFKIYSNAVMEKDFSENDNLRSFYNPESKKDKINNEVVLQDGYFDFNNLHINNEYLEHSSLFDSLKNKNFEINVYQSDKINMCHNSKVDNCVEKVNYPFVMQSDKISLNDRAMILVAQWIVSFGFVDSVNPLLNIVKYISGDIKPYPFQVNKLNAINSFKALDMIIDDIEHKGGNQAYFAVIDLPADSFVYDEYCSLKSIKEWVDDSSSVFAPTPLSVRQNAYLDQSMCLYGYLHKFMQQLESTGMDENTTVIITGLGTSNLLKDGKEDDFYRKLQSEQAVATAIKAPKAVNYAFDYSVCLTKNILDTYFSNRKMCQEFDFIKTTDKVIDGIRKTVNDDKINDGVVKKAMANFADWFDDWARNNSYVRNINKPLVVTNVNDEGGTDANIATEGNAVATSPTIIDNTETETVVAEVKEESIVNSIPLDKEEVPSDVIPETLFDNGEEKNIDNNEPEAAEPQGVSVNEVAENQDAEKAIDEKPANTEYEVPVESNLIFESVAETAQTETEGLSKENNPKQGYDLNKIIAEAKRKANLSAEELKEEASADVADVQNKAVVAQEQIEQTAKTLQNSTNNVKTAVKKTAETVTEEAAKRKAALREVLVAPETNGQKLSPEELKEQYHKMLRQN